MNIFVLDDSPQVAALYHCNRHIVKMILETAQILSTVHHRWDRPRAESFVERRELYKPTHANHPCVLWAGDRDSNYDWLWRLGIALCEEYGMRYSKVHGTMPLFRKALAQLPYALPQGQMTPHPQCMPEQYRGPDAVEAYRLYYVAEKSGFAVWPVKPHWWQPKMDAYDIWKEQQDGDKSGDSGPA